MLVLMQGLRDMRIGKKGTPATCLRWSVSLSSLLISSRFSPSHPLPVLHRLAPLPGRLDRGSVDVVGCPACPFHSLLLGARFARRLRRATGPKTLSKDVVRTNGVGENTRISVYLAIRGVMGY